MMRSGRREFFKAGSIAAGVLAAQGCATSGVAAASSQPQQVASFGWEAGNLYGNGADMYFEVLSNIMLNTVNIDVSAVILAATASGFAEVLCTAGVSRQTVPAFSNSGGHLYINLPASSNFGAVTAENPNNLTLYYSQSVAQDQFLALTLKTWVPGDGTASATSRQILAYPSLSIQAGDYLVFHMDHQGVSLDAEMQVVLGYSLT
jgi:hypothetical protein